MSNGLRQEHSPKPSKYANFFRIKCLHILASISYEFLSKHVRCKMSTTKQSIGGRARAEKLTPENRSNIAREAAKARWTETEKLPKATHRGDLHIGDFKIPCAVLADGRRVITEHGITSAMGSRSGASKRLKQASVTQGAPIPIFLAPERLKPFLTNELLEGPLKPILYRDSNRVVTAYEATALPIICDIWLRAREAGALQDQQAERAQKAEILMRSLAKIGVVALVDEATGYQFERERDALHQLLSVYLSEERLAWAKRFPDEFYKQIYRLRGWKWPAGRARTPLLGKITNDVVYERLPAAILPKLQEMNPIDSETKRRKHRHHQFLSEDVGQPDLRDHILQVIPLMKVSKTWDGFKRLMDTAFPKEGSQQYLDLDD